MAHSIWGLLTWKCQGLLRIVYMRSVCSPTELQLFPQCCILLCFCVVHCGMGFSLAWGGLGCAALKEGIIVGGFGDHHTPVTFTRHYWDVQCTTISPKPLSVDLIQVWVLGYIQSSVWVYTSHLPKVPCFLSSNKEGLLLHPQIRSALYPALIAKAFPDLLCPLFIQRDQHLEFSFWTSCLGYQAEFDHA